MCSTPQARAEAKYKSVATPKNYSVIKAFAILRAFEDADGWLSSCELSRRANLPIASGYRLIQTMEDIGIITKGKRGQYRPGMLLLSISRGVRLLDLLRDVGAPILKDLAESLNLATHLAISENGKVVCAGRYYSAPASPARFGATWKIPAEKVLAGSNEGRTEAFTGSDGALLFEIRSVSAAVYDSHGRTIAAISASDAVGRMTPAREIATKRALLDAAAKLQDLLYRDARWAKQGSLPPRAARAWAETVGGRSKVGFVAPGHPVSATAPKRLS